VALVRCWPTVARDAIEELKDLAQAVEIQQVIRWERGIGCGRGEIIRAAQGDGGMPPVRESDDEIRINPSAELEDLDALAAERMMRMGDGDESRRRLGGGGSLL
jgi:hypothetical protein